MVAAHHTRFSVLPTPNIGFGRMAREDRVGEQFSSFARALYVTMYGRLHGFDKRYGDACH